MDNLMTQLNVYGHGIYNAKEALVDVWDFEDDKMHCSVYVPAADGSKKVLSFEMIPSNYPSWSFLVFNSLSEYLEAISDVDWIMDDVSEDDIQFINELIADEEGK